jgi:hypothetical protein
MRVAQSEAEVFGPLPQHFESFQARWGSGATGYCTNFGAQSNKEGLRGFTLGVPSKLDRTRMTRLRDLMVAAGYDFQLVSCFAADPVNDRRRLSEAIGFLTQCFGQRFIYVGTLTEQGIAFFLNTCPIFVGFYGDGVRGNDTIFNTALRFGKKVITNLDEHSPVEIHGIPHVLDIDNSGVEALRKFIGAPVSTQNGAAGLFTWEKLVALCVSGTTTG